MCYAEADPCGGFPVASEPWYQDCKNDASDLGTAACFPNPDTLVFVLEPPVFSYLVVALMSGSSSRFLEIEEIKPKPYPTFSSISGRNAHQHSQLTRLLDDFCTSHTSQQYDITLLEIGCGSGDQIKDILSSKAHVMVWDVETEPDDLTAARSLNEFAIIQVDQCQIMDADHAHLSFSDGMFAIIVYSVNQFHTWSNRLEILREARCVLTPGEEY